MDVRVLNGLAFTSKFEGESVVIILSHLELLANYAQQCPLKSLTQHIPDIYSLQTLSILS